MTSDGYSEIFVATFLIFFAYAGFGKVTSAAEEVKNAAKTIPKTIIISVLVSAVLYLLVAVAALGAVGPKTLSSAGFRNAPLANVMLAVGSQWGFFVVLVGALTATSSVLLVQLLGASRNAYAMSENRQLPRFFLRLHPKYKTPYRTELIIGLLMALMALFSRPEELVALTGFGILGYYAVINLAALAMQVREQGFGISEIARALGFVACAALILYFIAATLRL